MHQHNLHILTRESHGHKNSSQQHSHELGHASEWCYQSLCISHQASLRQKRILINTVMLTWLLPSVSLLALKCFHLSAFLSFKHTISFWMYRVKFHQLQQTSLLTSLLVTRMTGKTNESKWKKRHNDVGFHTLDNNLSVRWLSISSRYKYISERIYRETKRGMPTVFPWLLGYLW